MSEPRDNEQQMEKFLAKVGEEWARESAPAAPADFLARVRAGVAATAEEAPAPAKVERVPRWHVRWPVLLAAAVVLMAAVLWMATDRFEGSELYADKGFVAPRKLSRGAIADAKLGAGVLELDQLRVLLHLNTGSELRLDGEDKVYLVRGDLWTTVKPNSGFFQVRTPQGSVTVHGTEFGVSVGPTGTVVELFKGSVSFAGPAGSVTLKPGDLATLAPGQPVPSASSVQRGVPAWAIAIRSRAAAAQAAKYYPSGRPAPASQGPPP